MKTITIDPLNPIFVDYMIACTGYFDGIHLGHQTLLEKANDIAAFTNLKKALITFARSPKGLLQGNDSPKNFTTLQERADKIEEFGFDYLIALDFDKQTLMSMSAKDFIVMLEKIGVKHIVCGEDYSFGKGKEGKAQDIEMISERNILASIMPIVSIDGQKIGSTQIKEMLGQNDLEGAKKMLGHDFEVQGVVEHGKHLGSQIGFPTANIFASSDVAVYLHGVFAVNIEIDGQIYKGMANIGYNPSVEDKKTKILEVNIFDFNQDIYGKTIKIIFKKFIRNEEKFSSVDELKKRLEKDKIEAQNILK